MKIKYVDPRIENGMIDKVNQALLEGRFGPGENVRKLESEWMAYCSTKYAYACNSGTSALMTALYALRIGYIGGGSLKDEVVVPAFTFIATPNSVVMCGAKPVFADITVSDFNIDVEDVRRKITVNTKAVIPVHFAGLMADMGPLIDLCEDKDIPIIEDACQAHGAEWIDDNNKSHRAGSLGRVNVFSLQESKNMNCGGEGGLITIPNDDDVAERCRCFIDQGQDSHYHHTIFGVNFRLGEVFGVIARGSLEQLDKNNAKRRKNAEYYSMNLDEKKYILPKEAHNRRSVWHLYIIRVRDQSKRSEVIKKLTDAGIEFGIHYDPANHLQPCYSQSDFGRNVNLPVTEKLGKDVLSIPVHHHLKKEELEYITEVLNSV